MYNDIHDLFVLHANHYRLAGFPPFWHRKQLVMLRNIMDGKYEFVSPEWDVISDAAKDLVRKNEGRWREGEKERGKRENGEREIGERG